MNEKELERIRKEVKTHQGQEIGTGYGPSLVVGIFHEDGVEKVHLKEFGEEDYSILIEDWDGLVLK